MFHTPKSSKSAHSSHSFRHKKTDDDREEGGEKETASRSTVHLRANRTSSGSEPAEKGSKSQPHFTHNLLLSPRSAFHRSASGTRSHHHFSKPVLEEDDESVFGMHVYFRSTSNMDMIQYKLRKCWGAVTAKGLLKLWGSQKKSLREPHNPKHVFLLSQLTVVFQPTDSLFNHYGGVLNAVTFVAHCLDLQTQHQFHLGFMTGERVKSWFDILYPRAAACKVMDPLDRSQEFVSLLTPGQPPMLALPDEYDKLPKVHMDTVFSGSESASDNEEPSTPIIEVQPEGPLCCTDCHSENMLRTPFCAQCGHKFEL